MHIFWTGIEHRNHLKIYSNQIGRLVGRCKMFSLGMRSLRLAHIIKKNPMKIDCKTFVPCDLVLFEHGSRNLYHSTVQFRESAYNVRVMAQFSVRWDGVSCTWNRREIGNILCLIKSHIGSRWLTVAVIMLL